MSIIDRLNKQHLVIVVGMLALTACGISADRTATATEPGPSITGVSAAQLAQEGMVLAQPSRAALHTQAEAEQAAHGKFDATILQTVLADVQDGNVPGVDGKTAWVISIMPAGGIYQPSRGPAGNTKRLSGTYMLMFFDSQTGAFIFGTIG